MADNRKWDAVEICGTDGLKNTLNSFQDKRYEVYSIYHTGHADNGYGVMTPIFTIVAFRRIKEKKDEGSKKKEAA